MTTSWRYKQESEVKHNLLELNVSPSPIISVIFSSNVSWRIFLWADRFISLKKWRIYLTNRHLAGCLLEFACFHAVILSRILYLIAPSTSSSHLPSSQSVQMAYSTLKMAKAYYGDSWKDIYTKPNKLSSTLDKLYAWEKKLYKEVKVCVRGHEPTKKGGKKRKKNCIKATHFLFKYLALQMTHYLFIYLFQFILLMFCQIQALVRMVLRLLSCLWCLFLWQACIYNVWIWLGI